MGDIFNFAEALKNVRADPSKIDRYELLHKLREIPSEYASEYAETLIGLIDDLIKLRTIVLSSEHPCLVKHMVEGLSETLLERLNTIVLNMIFYQGQKEVEAIVNATYGTVLSSES